ncbi:MAG: Rhs element Vgr protein [Acidimicrobiaceae bacterium]|nr:Rhs element Vgr protein [Acidimicrobiaceae bacterium]
MKRQWTSSLIVLVEGAPLDPLISKQLVRSVVENSLHLPDMFELTFTDPARQVVELGGFAPGVLVALAVDGGDEEPLPLMVGEVTALELEYDVDGVRTIVRGLDLSNRLMRGKKTRYYHDMMASEIIEEILAVNGIEENVIEPTDDLYIYKVQAGVTDWDFIQELAMDNGYRAYMVDNVFIFGPMPPPLEGMIPGTIEFSMPTQLVLGEGLVRLRAVVRSSEQVEDVMVTGWSPLEDGPVIGVAPSEAIGSEVSLQPAELAAVEGANTFMHLWFPTDDEAAAETKAAALGNQLAESYVELEGEAFGSAELKAGEAVSLANCGLPFDGAYTLTMTRHVFEPAQQGYLTHFAVSGWQDRTMLGLAKGPEVGAMPKPTRIAGVVSGTVVNCRDPEEQGRVQLMFEWMDPESISSWARVLQIGAGFGYGFLFVPEEGDEVLCAFEQGDPSRPIVLGGLYNTIQEPAASPALIDEATGLVNERRISSRFFHNITFYDAEEQSGILIQTGDEVAGIFLNAEEQTISIYNLDGAIAISGTDIAISAEGDLSLEAVGEVSIAGASVTIEGEGDLTLSGAAVELTGESEMSIDAPIVMING